VDAEVEVRLRGCSSLGSDDGEKLQLLDRLASGRCAEDEEPLILFLAEQDLAVDLDDAEDGVHYSLAVFAAYRDLVLLPQRHEFRALLP
jgi:sirohydrochlorin ferrochelatase